MSYARVVLGITGLILFSGCARNEGQTGPTGGTPPAMNRTDLGDLPPGVSAAFRREFPDAAITGVEQRSAETGAPIYLIRFINNRTPGSATYFINGQRLTPPQS